MKTKNVLFSVALAGAVMFVACNKDKDNNDNNMSAADQTFITQAAMANSAEVSLGQLATTNGSSDSVKSYGSFMVNEHSQAQADLRSIAGNNLFGSGADSLDAMHRDLYQRLSGLSGHDFDTAYINSQVLDHQNTITLFQTEANGGSSQQVKNYASTYLPHLQMHLQMAQRIQTNL